jgi:hypothetical protein
MAFGLPAFFGGKARIVASPIPPGLDVTSITDVSGSMGAFADFITSPQLYKALETALKAQGIGTLTANLNKYSFCVGATTGREGLGIIERASSVGGKARRWVLGSEVLADVVTYPTYSVGGSGNEDMAHATNLVSNNDRDYTTRNERVIISGSDEQSGMSSFFDPAPLYPHRYVGIHSVELSINENPTLPPAPSGVLTGFVYTTASEGVAIYIDGTTVSYRNSMPTSTFIAVPSRSLGETQRCIQQCKNTKGALYNIAKFGTAAKYALLGESLGTVLGKYLYSIS